MTARSRESRECLSATLPVDAAAGQKPAAGARVVVIGSGPGGSCIAALMSHAGHHVTLLEKNAFPGGKCSSHPLMGYVVDGGVHMFGRGPLGPFGDMARILGKGPSWSAPIPSFTPYLPGRGGLNMCARLFNPTSLRALAAARLRGWHRMALPSAAANAATALGMRRLLSLAGDFRRCRYPSVLAGGGLDRNVPAACGSSPAGGDISVRDFFAPLNEAEDFRRAIHCMTMLTMALPWHRASMSEFFYILASAVRSNHLCYPLGGCGAVPSAFLDALRERGGSVRLGCAASRIEVERGRAAGVTTAEGEFIPADVVISGAGMKPTLELAGRANFPPAYLEEAETRRESEAFIAVKLLLDRKLTYTGSPCLLRLPDLPSGKMFDYLEDGSVPDDLFLFVTVPSRWDPSLAPPGKDLLIAGVPASSLPERARQCERLLDRAEELLGEMFPGIGGEVAERSRTLTSDISLLTGKATGECIGLAQEVGQVGPNRLGAVTPIGGLYLVGADSGGRGIGTEMAADSALRVYQLLK